MIYDTVILTEQPIAKCQVTPELDRAAWLIADIPIIFNRKLNEQMKRRERKEQEKK